MYIACIYVCTYTDSYGGTLAGEDEANYLFSDDATAKDTIRYASRKKCVSIIYAAGMSTTL